MLSRVHTVNVDGGPGAGPGIGRVDSRHPGRLRVRSGREHRRLPGSEHHVRLARRVREDRQRRRRPGRDHELGLLRAGRSRRARPASSRPRTSSSSRRRLRASRSSRRPETKAATTATRSRPRRPVSPVLSVDDPVEPALRGGRRRHDDRRRHPARARAGLERRCRWAARAAAASPSRGRCRPGRTAPWCRPRATRAP